MLCPDPSSFQDRQVPRAPLPVSGVTSDGAMSRIASGGVLPPSSLIRAHASGHIPPGVSGLGLDAGSLQVVTSPCWEMVPPDVISACLSLDAWTPVAAVRRVRLPISSPTTTAFPTG